MTYPMTDVDIYEQVVKFYRTHTADEIHEVWCEVDKECKECHSNNPPTVTEYKKFLEKIYENKGKI